MSVLARLAETIASLSWDAIGENVREVARQRIFDTLGAGAVGLALPDAGPLRRLAGAGTNEADRVLLPIGAVRATEIDDISIACCATAGSVVVPVALAAAAGTADERTALLAVVAGYEAMIRLGVAFDGANSLYKGLWPTYLAAPLGAAVVTAKLLDLPAAAIEAAMGLALSRTAMAAGTAPGERSPRWYLLAAAAIDGMRAARAAAAGLGCDAAVLRPFAARLGVPFNDAALATAPDCGWWIRDIDTKLFPTSRQGLAAVDAMLRVAPPFADEAEIERIDIFVPAQCRAMIDRSGLPTDRIGSLLGVQYQVALAALDPERLHDVIRRELRADAAIQRLMAKIELHEAPSLTAAYPARWGGAVRVVRRSGSVDSVELREPAGSAAVAPGWDGLERKYARLAAASALDLAGTLQPLALSCRDLGREGGAAMPDLLAALRAG